MLSLWVEKVGECFLFFILWKPKECFCLCYQLYIGCLVQIWRQLPKCGLFLKIQSAILVVLVLALLVLLVFTELYSWMVVGSVSSPSKPILFFSYRNNSKVRDRVLQIDWRTKPNLAPKTLGVGNFSMTFDTQRNKKGGRYDRQSCKNRTICLASCLEL